MDAASVGLSPPLRAWLEQRLGRATPIQHAAWPAILAGDNVLLGAPTGAGKTLAAFLPLIDRLLAAPSSSTVQVLYVSPLKALASDIRRNLRLTLASLRPFLNDDVVLPRVALRTGDTSARLRQKLWEEPPAVLLTTPETLALLLTHDAAADLFAGLKHVVVDEVHALACGKRGADLSLSLERLEALTGPVQRIGLSATATPLEETARWLVGTRRPFKIAHVADSSPLELTVRPLPSGVAFLSRLLDELTPALTENRSTILFTGTRALAERVAWALRRRHPEWDEQIAVHHSSMAADRRRRVERRLKRGRLRAVVSSTSLELGIDIGSVDLVVLVHPPGDVVRLLQRVGRSGHAPGLPHRGLVLTSGPAELLEAAVTAAAGRSGQCEPLRTSSRPFDVLCQQLLGMAVTRDWSADNAFDLVRCAHPYRDLTREEFDAALDYLTGSGGLLPARLRLDDDVFSILDERTIRLLRRNLGTILSEETCEVVRIEGDDERVIGHVDEAFVERLQPGERFLLSGLCLEYRRLERGVVPRVMTVEVHGRPRAPRWAGEGEPMSSRLAERLYYFRNGAAEALLDGREALRRLVSTDYGLEGEAIDDVVDLFVRQESISEIPDPRTLLIERVPAQSVTTYCLHTPLNRRGNDVLARLLTLRLGDAAPRVGLVADLGLALYVQGGTEIGPADFRRLLSSDEFEADLRRALAGSQVLRERFQRVALTGLMLLRNPLGARRKVGGHDWGERRLFDRMLTARPDFILLRQAEREISDEVCDVEEAKRYLESLPRREIRVRTLSALSPFVESWSESASVSVPPPTPEEVLRRLHEELTGQTRHGTGSG